MKPAPVAESSRLSDFETRSSAATLPPATASHAITQLTSWAGLQEATRAVVAETLNAPVVLALAPTSSALPAYAVACSLTDAEHQVELTVVLAAANPAAREIGRLMLEDSTLAHGQAAMGELSNIVAGRLQTNFAGEGYAFTMSIYGDTDDAKRERLRRLASAFASVALTAGDGAALDAYFFLRPNAAVEISGADLFDGAVLAEDLVSDRNALLVRTGTRLTSSAIEQVRDHVQRKRVKVCTPHSD